MTGRAYSRAIGATALASACLLLCLAPARSATPSPVMPKPDTEYTVFDHRTVGDGWHLEMTVSKDPHFLSQLVLYSERCNESVQTKHVFIRDNGSIASSKPFAASTGKHGTWSLDAQWTDPDHVTGSFRITRPGCDGRVRNFSAAGEPPGGAQHVHTIHGTPPGSYPKLRSASARARAQARRLWKDSKRAAKRRFPTYRRVLALGFKRMPFRPERPLLFHVRNQTYRDDTRTFDAARPESLVYWWPANRGPILIGFMYRAPLAAGWPKFAKPLFGWHTHGEGNTLMTHVWLTNDLRSAIANCMPAKQLEAANPRLHFQKAVRRAVLEARPCPAPQP